MEGQAVASCGAGDASCASFSGTNMRRSAKYFQELSRLLSSVKDGRLVTLNCRFRFRGNVIQVLCTEIER